MVPFSNSIVIIMVIAVFADSRSVPLKIPQTQPTEIASTLVLADIPPTGEDNVEGNGIQSSEENVNPVVYETYTNEKVIDDIKEKSPKQVSEVEEARNENVPAQRTNAKSNNIKFSSESDNLSILYRNGQRSLSVSDAIVFPTTMVEFKTLEEDGKNISARKGTQNQMNYRYSNIRMPNDYPDSEVQPTKVIYPKPDILPLFSKEQESLTYELLAQLLRSILRRPHFYEIEEQPTTTTETATLYSNEGVDFQSLYSGPRLNKSPCPQGQHRAHNGLCQEVSRKLENSRG